MGKSQVATNGGPGRYLPANGRVVSRLLSKGGMQRSAFWGFTVERNKVSVFSGGKTRPASAIDSLLAKAESILTDAGYLVLRGCTFTNKKPGNWFNVYRRVTTTDHAHEFSRSSWCCKVVTPAGEIIDATKDPEVRAELAANKAAEEERKAAEETAKEAARAAQDEAVSRLRSAGIESAQKTWRDSTVVTVSVKDVDRLLGAARA